MGFMRSYDPDSTPIPFTIPRGRGLMVNPSEGAKRPYTEAFFYHPDGASPSAVSQRIMEGQFNPYLDDPFALAIQDTKDLLRRNAQKLSRVLTRAGGASEAIAPVENRRSDLVAHLRAQHEAVAKYQRGDALNAEERDRLTPDADCLLRRLKEDAEDQSPAEGLLAGAPDGSDDPDILPPAAKQRRKPLNCHRKPWRSRSIQHWSSTLLRTSSVDTASNTRIDLAR